MVGYALRSPAPAATVAQSRIQARLGGFLVASSLLALCLILAGTDIGLVAASLGLGTTGALVLALAMRRRQVRSWVDPTSLTAIAYSIYIVVTGLDVNYRLLSTEALHVAPGLSIARDEAISASWLACLFGAGLVLALLPARRRNRAKRPRGSPLPSKRLSLSSPPLYVLLVLASGLLASIYLTAGPSILSRTRAELFALSGYRLMAISGSAMLTVVAAAAAINWSLGDRRGLPLLMLALASVAVFSLPFGDRRAIFTVALAVSCALLTTRSSRPSVLSRRYIVAGAGLLILLGLMGQFRAYIPDLAAGRESPSSLIRQGVLGDAIGRLRPSEQDPFGPYSSIALIQEVIDEPRLGAGIASAAVAVVPDSLIPTPLESPPAVYYADTLRARSPSIPESAGFGFSPVSLGWLDAGEVGVVVVGALVGMIARIFSGYAAVAASPLQYLIASTAIPQFVLVFRQGFVPPEEIMLYTATVASIALASRAAGTSGRHL